MEINYELLITGLRKAPFLKDSEYNNVITKVECKLSATDTNSNTVLDTNFVVDLDINNISSFIDLAVLEESTVKSWVEASVTYEKEKQTLYSRFDEIFYPTNEEVTELDWINKVSVIEQINSLEEQVDLLNSSIESLKLNNGITV